jgi:hypothetical protein
LEIVDKVDPKSLKEAVRYDRAYPKEEMIHTPLTPQVFALMKNIQTTQTQP